MAAGKDQGKNQVDGGGLEFDEQGVVHAQGQSPQHQRHDRRAEVHAVQTPLDDGIPGHQREQRHDQHDGAEVYVPPKNGAQKGQRRERINPFAHAAIILSGFCAHPAMAADYFEIHSENPHGRQIRQIVERLREGAIIAYPTDSCYAFGCHIGDKDALERIRRIRQLDKHHNMTLVCRELAEIATYARVDNWQFRMLKHVTPGPYAFILQATHQVPRRLQTGKRKTIGVRVPDNVIAQALLAELGEPILSCTAQLPGEDEPLNEAWDIRDALLNQLDIIIDGGPCGLEPTTVVDLSESEARVLREGKGPLGPLGL